MPKSRVIKVSHGENRPQGQNVRKNLVSHKKSTPSEQKNDIVKG